MIRTPFIQFALYLMGLGTITAVFAVWKLITQSRYEGDFWASMFLIGSFSLIIGSLLVLGSLIIQLT